MLQLPFCRMFFLLFFWHTCVPSWAAPLSGQSLIDCELLQRERGARALLETLWTSDVEAVSSSACRASMAFRTCGRWYSWMARKFEITSCLKLWKGKIVFSRAMLPSTPFLQHFRSTVGIWPKLRYLRLGRSSQGGLATHRIYTFKCQSAFKNVQI